VKNLCRMAKGVTEAEVEAAVEDARQFAEASPWPEAASATRFVYDEPPGTEPTLDGTSKPDGAIHEISFMQATLEALGDEMARDPRIFVMGEGIGKRGGNFRTTAGLFDRYGPVRLCDTPICERGFVGLSCGAAMTGTRPVIDFMFADFVLDGVGEIVNQIAKIAYMSSGRLKMPVVLRGCIGIGSSIPEVSGNARRRERIMSDTASKPVALVTGAAQGIGEGIARMLGAAGHILVLGDVDGGLVQQISRETSCRVTEPRLPGTWPPRSVLRQVRFHFTRIDLADGVGRAVEHELELAADGDELKALPGTPQGIFGREDMKSAGDSMALGCLEDSRQGPLEHLLRGHGSVGRAHRVGQVVGSDEDGVDAGHGVDLIGHIDGSNVLGLDDDQDLVVGVAVILFGGGAVVDRVEAAADRAIAPRRVLGCRDDGSRLGGVQHHRCHDAHRATVQHHLDPLVFPGRNAGQRHAAGVGDGAEHHRRGLDIRVGMLHVHGEPGKPRAGQEPRRRHAAQRQPRADLRLARLQRPDDWILFQRWSPVSKRKLRVSDAPSR